MKKILVIEDECSQRTVVQEVLMAEGYECFGARNGLEGVEAAKSIMPDLIISDVMMPQMDGFGVLHELQKDPDTSLIPFIFLTGQTDREDLRRGMSLGADDYLFKPFTYEELLTAVAQRLKKHELLHSAASSRAEELKFYLNTTLPHELRTPLSGIIGYLDMLTTDFDGYDSDTVKMMVQHMSYSASRLYRLVENYLMYAQFMMTLQDHAVIAELRHYALCPDPRDIVSLNAEKVAAVHKRGNDLVIGDLANDVLSLYPENLEKIASELIDNAFKFSPDGTPVTVQAAVEANNYYLKIADRGRGMTAEQIAAIGANQQFNRARHEQQGVGLGLTIAKQICRIFGGDLIVSTNASGGITVTAKLCLASVTQPADRTAISTSPRQLNF